MSSLKGGTQSLVWGSGSSRGHRMGRSCLQKWHVEGSLRGVTVDPIQGHLVGQRYVRSKRLGSMPDLVAVEVGTNKHWY